MFDKRQIKCRRQFSSSCLVLVLLSVIFLSSLQQQRVQEAQERARDEDPET